MTLTEYQSFLLRLTAIEDNTKIREERILNLEAKLHEAQVEIQALKKQLRGVDKTVNNTKDSLEFTQGEHDDLVERVANCENEQSNCWDELTHLNIYSRRSNFLQSQWVQRRGLLLAGTWRFNPKFKPTTRRSLEYEALRGTPSWQAKRKQSPTSHCSLQRHRAWKARYRPKNSRISMGEDLPKHIQEIRKNVLIPAMKKIKQETPSHKATVIGDKLVVNGKVFFMMTCRRNGSFSTLQWIPVRIMAMGTAEYQEPLAKSRRILWCYGPIPRTA